MAVRMPTSRVRAVAREISRFATLAQAMSSTMKTAPSIVYSMFTISLPMNARTYGSARTPMPLLMSGYSASRRAAIALNSATAASRVTRDCRWIELQRHPDLFRHGERKAGWHHANNGRLATVGPDYLADNAGVAAEPCLPRVVSQQHHVRRTGLAVLRREGSADQRLLAEEREHLGRHECAVESFRPVDAADVDGADEIASDVDKGLLLCTVILVVVLREAYTLLSFGQVRATDGDELIRILEWQATQDCSVHDAEHHGSEPDAKGERHDGDARGARILYQHARAVAHVLDKRVHVPGPRKS
jgi:hypothetical protein